MGLNFRQPLKNTGLKPNRPGNVRQLENIIKGAVGAGADKLIEITHLPREMRKLAKDNGGGL